MFQFNLTLLPSNSVEAVRKIIEAVRLFVEAVRLLVEAGRVLRSSANKSIPIDPRLRNNFLHSRFDPVKFRAIVLFASISQSFGVNQFVLFRFCKVVD